MEHVINMMLGGLLGWTITLLFEHQRWLPCQGDFVGGLLGSLAGSVMATTLGGAAASNTHTMASLVGAAVAIAVWRSVRGRFTRRAAGPSASHRSGSLPRSMA
ncbi:hypothetical protein [Ideonella sp.]|uniref:hypothetical protein n=1 Tax=Ideonella sp. TaxID=1929293 RepID=UPI0035B098FE